MTAVTAAPGRSETNAFRGLLPQLAPFLGILALAIILPFVSNDYWALIGTRAAIYWVLVSGLNLVVGFAGHLAIGYVALLTLGAYVTSVLVAGNVLPPVPVFAALPIAGCVGAVFGVIVGLPALRLRTFYFAMSTLGFATIVTQIALAWQSVHLQQNGTHDALNLAGFLRVAALFADALEFVEKQHAGKLADIIDDLLKSRSRFAEIAANQALIAHDKERHCDNDMKGSWNRRWPRHPPAYQEPAPDSRRHAGPR